MRLNDGLEALGTDEDECGVFQGSPVESVVLPSTLKRIECYTFYTCKNLRSISLPERLEFIGRGCFSLSGLESVEFPASLRTISQGAFAKCRSLKVVKFNEGLEVLGTEEYLDDDKLYYGVF